MKNKNMIATLAIFATLAGGSLALTTDAYAVGVSFYQFTGAHKGGSLPNVIYSNDWTTNSSNNTVTINGWQDGYGLGSNVTYEVCQKVLFGYQSNWVPFTATQNYPKNGTWYGNSFQGIPNGITAALRATINSGNAVDGAGNAYQS